MNATTQAEKNAAQREMDVAHAKAEAVRAVSSGSYSGGADGSQYIPLNQGGGGGSYGGGGGGYTPVYTYYTISASAGKGGSISPNGISAVLAGDSQSYTISASKGYKISNVTVDGSSVGAVSSYTFSSAAANHSISASFVPSGRVNIGSAGLADKDGKTSVKSGYGIFANIRTDYVDVDNVSVSATYNFGKGNKTVALAETSSQHFEFPANRESPTKSRCVYIPVNTKDKTYTVTFTITGTNIEGAVMTATRTATITVKGNMYEDDFTADK